ncbi:hypothetical protein C1645_839217 [Glomus cerebriforme]|uniref:Uncharacterized protein n=1 Tax=Glomus cerebriforme TaxID=658196 RepID=A0A397S3T6_9GLOM|nr:hypothetical protein C1645_839217 [Glomus cerebriforme]
MLILELIANLELAHDMIEPFEEPTNESKPRKIESTNDLELAIYHCKGRELNDMMIVAYLLEYYTRHAIEYAGWMTTVSRALPFLYKYHYVDYAKKLFRKECFADQDHFSAQHPYDIIPNGFRSEYFHEKVFIAFRPNKLVKFFDKDYEKSPIALCMVPLPGFTIHKIKKKIKKENNDKTAEFDINKLSPFARVIRYEDNDDMYDNPATEAVIDFHWFALLQNPNIINKKNSTFSGNATNNNEMLDIEIKSNINYKDNNDNPFSGFLTSVEAAYFWTSDLEEKSTYNRYNFVPFDYDKFSIWKYGDSNNEINGVNSKN